MLLHRLAHKSGALEHFDHLALDTIVQSIRAHIGPFSDDGIKHYDGRSVTMTNVSVYPIPIHYVCQKNSLHNIQNQMDCDVCISVDGTYFLKKPAVLSYFIYHQLASVQRTYAKIAYAIAHARKYPEKYTHDMRPITTIMPCDEQVLLWPKQSWAWYFAIQQEVAYRTQLCQQQPDSNPIAEVSYWLSHEQSVASHMQRIRAQSVSKHDTDRHLLRRIDSHIEALHADCIMPYEPPRISSYWEIQRIREGHITSSLVYYNYVLERSRKGASRTTRV